MSITFEKVIILKNIPLFQDISEQALADLISGAEEQKFKSEEIILEEEAETNSLYIILEGKVQFIHRSKVIREFSQRQTFGEETVFFKTKFPFKIQTSEKTILLKITSAHIYHMICLYPSFAYGFIGNLSLNLLQQKNHK